MQHGELYHLLGSEEPTNVIVNQYVARDGDQAVVFAFLHSSREQYPFPRVALRGLEPTATYSLEALEGALALDTPMRASGAYWMQQGVDILLQGDFQAAAIVLHRVATTSTTDPDAAAHNHEELRH